MTDPISTGFSLHSDESGFKTRCDDVFAGLATLEKKHDALVTVQSRKRSNDERRILQNSDPYEEPVQPCQGGSVFRYPRGRASHRPQYGPGFRKDPKKWTSYDLSDVTRDQLSNKGNTAAALSFLYERRKAREGEKDETPADLSQKVEFSCHRSLKDSKSETGDTSNTKFCGGKLVMPEYDIGQRMIKRKTKWRKVDKSESTGSAVNLGYLEEDGNEEVADISSGSCEQNIEEQQESSDNSGLTFDTKQKSEEEISTETDFSKLDDNNSESKSLGTKFKKKPGRKGIRQRQQKDDEDE